MATKLSIQRRTYDDIRKHCHLVGTERAKDYTKDYTLRRERWKHGDVIYTVLLKITTSRERVLRITGHVKARELA